MKSGVVSDTHSIDVPRIVFDAFGKVDFIIHAGDICSQKDLKRFTDVNTVKAVHGNMDDGELTHQLPRRDIVEAGGFKIGIYHGDGSPKTCLKFVQAEFMKDDVDAVVFGHSHMPFNELIDGVLYFNPGSPNDNIRAPYHSYGILEEKKGQLVGKIIKI